MNRAQSNKINPLVNQIFPEEDLRYKYKVKKIIGKGYYGYVAKALDKRSNQFVAIKKIINLFQNQPETKRILREIVLLKNNKHPNVVTLVQILIPFRQTIENFDKIYIITQYCDTDLRKLFQMQETYLQMDDVKFIFYQIACGVKYLHSASVIHRDLTPSNILINGQGMKIKICDLGLARVVQKNQKQEKQSCSSGDQSMEKEMKSLSILSEDQSKRQSLNIFEHIDSQSITSSQNLDSQSIQRYFKYNSSTVSKGQNNQDQKFNHSLNQKDNQVQFGTVHQNEQSPNSSDKKNKRLKRMNSKRSEDLPSAQRFQKKKQQFVSKFQTDFPPESEQSISKKRLSKNPLSKLTLRVTTRWYRAPEIILLQRKYNKPIDIWSLGCLFGELLKMIKSVCYNSLQRFPLFPGKYCYPVSPATLCHIHQQALNQTSKNMRNDQLFMILSTIGKPSEEDMSFLSDEGAKQYIKSIKQFQRKQFKKFFPSVSKQAIQLLEATLQFNPHKRIKINQILDHPFLDSVRNRDLQVESSPVIMQFEEQQDLTIGKLKKYLASQIQPYISKQTK